MAESLEVEVRSTVYVVWETQEYEGWNLCAVFLREQDAQACVAALNEEAYVRLAQLRVELGLEAPERHDVHIYEEKPLCLTLADWHATRGV